MSSYNINSMVSHTLSKLCNFNLCNENSTVRSFEQVIIDF